VTLPSPPGVAKTIRCAVALPTVSDDGPHISIRKQAPEVMTPVDLLERDSLPTELVALLYNSTRIRVSSCSAARPVSERQH